MKKILLYTDTPLLGGAENQMYLLAKFLPKEKYTITLACSNYEALDRWSDEFKAIGCDVERLAVSHKHDPRHFLYAKNLFEKFDLVHLHVWNPASNRLALMAIKAFGKRMPPIVITEHDPFPLNGIKSFLKKKLLRGISSVIVPSEGAKKIFVSEFPEIAEKITVIANGIDSEHWEAQVNSTASGREEGATVTRDVMRRDMFQATAETKVILCVAELNPRKGQKYLIEGFEKVAKEFPNAKLIFVGEGPARDEYEFITSNLVHSSIRGRIHFLGRKPHIAPLMASADLFVLPSVREAFGLVLLEAAIAKLPIIATNVGGIPEILDNEKTALLVAPQNSDALAQALTALLADPEKADLLAQNAYSHVRKTFHAKIMAEKTAEVYDALLREKAEQIQNNQTA